MKRIFSLTVFFSLFISLQLSAQLREDLNKRYHSQNTVVNTSAPTIQSSLNNFFMNNVSMSHSYSMNFGSVGGSFQNVNAYTNTMQFAFTPQFTGRLDVSFLHSPFGQSNMMNSNNALGGEILIRNAELNYQINENAHIKLQYQQLPRSFGFYNPYGYNRFNNFGLWY